MDKTRRESVSSPSTADEKLTKTKAYLKSVEKNLQHLVGVHRQLLRKYASLEVENVDLRKRVTSRDERINELEMNARIRNANMRSQADIHQLELDRMKAVYESQTEVVITLSCIFFTLCLLVIIIPNDTNQATKSLGSNINSSAMNTSRVIKPIRGGGGGGSSMSHITGGSTSVTDVTGRGSVTSTPPKKGSVEGGGNIFTRILWG